MYADTIKATREGSLYFDERTILAVEQRGGGGAGVAGNAGVVGGLRAENLITGESTESVIVEKNETITEQAATIAMQAGTIEEQAAEITTKDAEIDRLEDVNEELTEQLSNSYVGITGQLQFYCTSKINSPDIGKTVRCIYTDNKYTNALRTWNSTFVNANSTSSETNIRPLFKGAFSGTTNDVAIIIVPTEITPVFQLPNGYVSRVYATESNSTLYEIVATESANPADIIRVRFNASDPV